MIFGKKNDPITEFMWDKTEEVGHLYAYLEDKNKRIGLVRFASDFTSDLVTSDNFSLHIDGLDKTREFKHALSIGLAQGSLFVRIVDNSGINDLEFVGAHDYVVYDKIGDKITRVVSRKRKSEKNGNNTKYYALYEDYQLASEGWVIKRYAYELDSAFGNPKRNISLTAFGVSDSIVRTGTSTAPFAVVEFNKAVASELKGLSMDLEAIYTDMVWEYTASRKRIVVPKQFAKTEYNIDTGRIESRVDLDKSVFIEIEAGLDGVIQPKEFGGNIRFDSYESGISYILSIANAKLGLSKGAISLDEASGGLTTATQVMYDKQKTLQVREAVVSSLSKAFDAIGVFAKVRYVFGDGALDSKQEITERYLKLYNSGLISKKYALTKIEGLSEEEAEKVVVDSATEEIKFDDLDFGGSV